MIYITTYPLTQRINPMRKLLLTTAAVAAAIAGAECGNSDPNTFTDTRDGQTYKTVKMPDGKTWMAQNLNYKTDSSWCYKNLVIRYDDSGAPTTDFTGNGIAVANYTTSADSNCVTYGRLYDWNTATTVCPKGWKLSSREDWDRLVATADGEEITGKKLLPATFST